MTTVNAYYNAEYYQQPGGPWRQFRQNNLSLALITVFGAILSLCRGK